ncbi:hypothetical protein [Pseudoalteromonas aurantia]|uniref:Uncharacterized protein n=1 Tax=Pseudoalteromonas aurantia 208 TaxID=1314867 RepID=A0ABR9EBN9_9GAMM|nr:hypothetical protein [Pseudoalteromonas aurantia]MBE0368415.1 hypothetical protein [Pseudoalteromonas aurantia 208]
MSTEQVPWVKTASETYEDCIVGNREGLLQLKDAIDKAIQEDSVSPEFKSDFISVVCTKEEWDCTEASNIPAWQELLFKVLCVGWLLILPIIGIFTVIKWLR